MFRKLVSNLPYSPALVGQLGFYAGRLRTEQVVRRLGLLCIVAALVVQAFALFNPPIQASASSASAVIPGGISSVAQILDVYDAGAAGQNDFKALMDYFGVTRNELAGMGQHITYTCSNDHSIVSFSRAQHYSSAEGELTHRVPTDNGGSSTFYSVPLYRYDQLEHQTNCYDSYVGHSSAVGWFAIMRKCGNFQIKQSVRTLPRAHLNTASCSAVQGFAYDQRGQDQKVKVYLFFAGPPGKGESYGPITASATNPTSPAGDGHGFSFAVPDKYQNSAEPIPVWAVMQPLAGWTEPMVQADNTLQIPARCNTVRAATASCNALKVGTISRTKFSFTASANTVNSQVNSYTYTVTNSANKPVFGKTYTSQSLANTSETIELKDTGQYTVKALVKTSSGDKQSADCSKTFTVATTTQCIYSPALEKNDANCQACPYDTAIWLKDNGCSPPIALSKEAYNLSQAGKNANHTTAQPGDRIQYDLHTINLGPTVATTTLHDDIRDLLEYATIIDSGGGTVDAAHSIGWDTTVQLRPGTVDTRSFVIQINDPIANTPRAANDPAAYDCVITNSYGNTTAITMACPFGKTVENTVRKLPATGIGGNIAFSTVVLLLAAYLYARSRQLHKEIRVIRRDFNSGTL